MKPLRVKEIEAGQRLDQWLSLKLGLSRNQVQKTIKGGGLTINGRIAKAHQVLKYKDEVIVGEVVAKAPVAKGRNYETPPDPTIIAETDEYLVINKPAGLLMHGAASEKRISLVDWLLKHYPKIAKVGEDPARPGIVHRLDKDVSGLVIIPKTQDSFDNIKKQFQTRAIEKTYHALVYDAGMPDEDEILFRMERSSKGYRMAAKPQNQTGKAAITLFEVEKRFINYTYLRLVIKTGRTHQIRAHLAAFNHPVVGDDLYGSPRHKLFNKKLGLGRVFLVATDLSFTDLQGERQSFSIKLPEQLQKILKNVK